MIMHPHRMRILQPQRGCFVIRVLYGRRKVGDDGYPGLRFAYPGLYASPASRPHMLRMSSQQHRCRHIHNNPTVMPGECDTPLQATPAPRKPPAPRKRYAPTCRCRGVVVCFVELCMLYVHQIVDNAQCLVGVHHVELILFHISLDLGFLIREFLIYVVD